MNGPTKKPTRQTTSKPTGKKSPAKPRAGKDGHPPAPFSKSRSSTKRSPPSTGKTTSRAARGPASTSRGKRPSIAVRKAAATRSAQAALKRAAAKIRQLEAKGAAAKRAAKAHRAELAKLKSKLKDARKAGKSAKARSKVTRAANAAAQRATRAAPPTVSRETRLSAESRTYSGPEVPMPENGFAESRLFRSGASLLGYLEGRPGILKIQSVTPLLPPIGTTPTQHERGRPADVAARIEALDLLITDRGSNHEALIWDAYWDAEDFGALLEVEVDSDSGGDT